MENVGNIMPDGIRKSEYDQRNRLIRVEIGGATIAEYAYDAFNRRVKKVADGETTHFHYDADGLLICETDGSGNALRDYVYLNGEPVAMRVAGDWYWFLNDHLGTPRKMVDASGAVVWRAAYLPFGKAIVAQADVENNLRFPGQYFDAETGLHYNWHRYYDPGTGRYLRADPIGLAGGINLFAYAANNPINYFDTNGLIWDTLLDIGFMIWDVVDIATADNPCERRAAFTSLGMDALGAAIPFATGLGKGYKAGKKISKTGRGNLTHATDFDQARRQAFENAGMTDPDRVKFSKYDPDTGTVVEFKGEKGAKVAYDSPHADMDPLKGHEKPHIGWQSGGKQPTGGHRGNITYDGSQHPSRPSTK